MRSATRRAVASAVPPAGKPLTIFTCSKPCARSAKGRAASAPNAALDWTKCLRVLMRCLLSLVREESGGRGRAAGAQVGFDDTRVACQLGGGPVHPDLAGLEQVAVVGDFQRGAGVLLDQQDRHALLAQAADDLEDLAHHQRRQAQA